MGLTKIRAAQISDIDYKQSARVLTDTNITLTGGAPLVVDGVTLLDIDRVLVKGQTNAAENGIYRVLIPGTGSDGTWIRSSDANETGEIEAGMIIMVTEGAVYGDTQWKLITNDPIIIGVTPLVFEQNSAFAFGNIYANNTAILANVVGDTLTVTPSNNISMVGNATTKTLTLGVVASGSNSDVQFNVNGNLAASNTFQFEPGNTLLVTNANITTTQFYFGDGSQLTNIAAAGGTRISSGNSNIAIASSNGVGNVSIAGVQNVVFFTTDGISTTGNYYANTGYFAGDPNLQLWANTLITANIGTTQVVQIDDTGLEVSNLRVNIIESPDSTFVDIRDGLQASEIVLSGNIFGAGAVFDGNVTANYFYGNGALLTGIDATSIQNGTSSVKVLSSGGNIQANVAGNAVLLLTPDGANIYGNVEANYYYGNGSQLTGIEAFSNLVPQSYWLQPNIAGEFPIVANDQGLLFAVAGNGIIFDTDPSNHTITINAGLSSVDYDLVTQAATVSEDLGNVTANATSEYDWGSLSATAGLLESLGGVIAVGDITTQANVIADYVVANVDAATLSASSITGSSITATGNISASGITATGNISASGITATGNISATYFLGNGSLLTGLPVQYSNTNVAAYLPTYSGNLVSLTGNVTTTANVSAAYFVGNGRVLTGLYDNIAANVLPAANITYDLGSTTRRWNDLWLANSTIYIGEATISATGANLVLPAVVQIGNTVIDGATSGELRADNLYGNVFTALIDSADSSAITITPDVVAQASMEVQEDLTVLGRSTLTEVSISRTLVGNITVEDNSANDALRINQTGAGNALLVEDSTNPDATPFVITAGGNVGIGVYPPLGYFHANVGDVSGDRMILETNSDGGTSPLNLWNSNTGNTVGSGMVISAGGDGVTTGFIGGLSSRKIDANNSRTLLRVLTGNVLTGLTDDAANVPFYIQGTDSGPYIVMNANTGVGINTTTPNANFALDVAGAINATEYYGNGQGLTGLTANNIGAIQNGNSNIAVSANGNITMSVAGIGNIIVITDTGVGFGNSAPQSRLVVQGLASNTNTPLFEYYNSASVLKSNMTSRGAQNWFIQSGDDTERGSIRYSTPGGALGILFISPDTGNRSDFKHKPGGGFVWGAWGPTGNVLVTPPELMWLDVNGNLSIGVAPVTTDANLTYKLQANGVIADDKGDVRSTPENIQTAPYTLVLSDAGKYISSNANVTVPNGVFSSGQSVSVYNNSASSITISPATSVTMYLVGTATTGNRTLAQRGLATISCVGANTFVASGGGLT